VISPHASDSVINAIDLKSIIPYRFFVFIMLPSVSIVANFERGCVIYCSCYK
jgi:hypothetical protein